MTYQSPRQADQMPESSYQNAALSRGLQAAKLAHSSSVPLGHDRFVGHSERGIPDNGGVGEDPCSGCGASAIALKGNAGL